MSAVRMRFFTTDLEGVTLVNPDVSARREIIASVDEAVDADYPEVYLTMDSGFVLGYRAGGILFEEVDGEVVALIRNVDRDQVEKAWNALVEGRMADVEALPWVSLEP